MFSIIDGVEISKSIYSECEEKLKNLNKKLKLSVIQIGDDEASTIYANRKKKMCEKYGIDFEIYNFDIYSIETDIIDLINKLNNDDKVTGIFVFWVTSFDMIYYQNEKLFKYKMTLAKDKYSFKFIVDGV